MKRIIILLVAITAVFTQTICAQEEQEPAPPKGFDKSKLFFGGNFGLGLGSNSSSIIVSPQVGYRFNNHFAAGAGINFNYYSYRTFYNGEAKDRFGYAGLNIFGRVYPIPYLIVQAQPELNYSWGSRKYEDNRPTERLKGLLVPSLLLGGGAAIPTGGNGALLLMLQYDVLQEPRTPYGNKIFFSMGYNF